MRFGVLGPLETRTTAGDEVEIPESKIRALLAVLLTHRRRLVSVDLIVDELWGDRPPANPAAAVQLKVSRLRKVLAAAESGGRDLVVSRAPGYLLDAPAEAVDADRFERLVSRARAAGDLRVRATLLSEALTLWRGAAFADFADYEFVRACTARLDEERLVALEDLAEARLGFADPGSVVAELADLVALHPMRERLRAVHMLALYRAGRQGEALASYRELHAVLDDQLGVAPGPRVTTLHQAILRHDPALFPAEDAVLRTNLPVALTPMVGREDAVPELCALLSGERLVTLLGLGGIGKTRLALEVARSCADRFPDGVRLVELAPVARGGGADAVVRAVLAVLGVREATADPGTPLDLLVGALADKELLLVLDNCEHLVAGVAEVAGALLASAPGLRVLATSREPLGLVGEALWSVPSLGVPTEDVEDHAAALGAFSAVRLFVARATSAAPGFRLDRSNARAVARLCRRLDGLPLALELAAARVRTLGVADLLSRLDDRFRVLGSGPRGVPERQRTLRATIDWSWELLSEQERTVLVRLTAFAGGCAVDAAEAVCAGGGIDPGDVLDLVARLVDRCLVRVSYSGGAARYWLLETIAEYCRELDRDDRAATGERHRRYYLDLAEGADPELRGPEQALWLARLDVESANLRAALADAVAAGAADEALRLVTASAWYWFLRGRLREAVESCSAALALDAGDPVLRARAAVWREGLALVAGDQSAVRRGAEALAAYEELDDAPGLARARWFLGFVGSDFADLATSEHLVARALDAFRELGDRWGEAAALSTLAKNGMVRGDLAALKTFGSDSMDLFVRLGDRWGQLQATDSLTTLAEIVGDYEYAGALHWDGLRTAEELGLWPEVSSRLSWLGRMAMLKADFSVAREYHERAKRLAVEQGYKPGEVFATMGLGIAARREGKLDLADSQLGAVLSWLPREADEVGDTLPLALITPELGFIAEQRGDASTARALHLKGLRIASRLAGDPRGVVLSLEGLAGAQALDGDHRRAARLLGAAAASRRSADAPLAPAEMGDVERITAAITAHLGAEAFEAEFARGGLLTPAEASAGLG
ncbi:BTAD domain-containing putative transcriptional regulator [Actinosynnema sp. NPDC050436]|uniref:BTAD domain-containing putative transcriptional regulator n=1 Tax=Actinosynnema sp. NPDC050436 TaxID=3155659 RepID=UPI0033F9EEBF